MKENPFRQEREEMKELLRQYNNFKSGRKFTFLEEESFERIIDYFDDIEDLALALEAVNFAVEQYPYSASLLLKKADILIASRCYLTALDVLHAAELLDSGDINLYILKTDVYLALENQQQAAAILEEALHLFDGEEKIELLFELADVYDDYENFDKVFDCLVMVLNLDPTNEEALYKICFWADFTKRESESIELHQKLIDEHPYNLLAWFNLGAAYQSLKLYEQAIDAYLYAIAIDEKFDYAYRNLADAYMRLRNYRDAIEALEQVIELSAPESVIYEAIGHCYEKLKNPVQARFHYRKAAHLNSQDSLIYYKIARTYMEEGYWNSAIDNLKLAISINRSHPDFLLALAQCYSELDCIKEAVIYFTQYIKARPKNTRGWTELLKCLYDAGYFEEALDQVHNALENTGEKAIFIYYKAAILFSLSKSKEAMVQLQNAIQLAPTKVKKFIELDPSFLQRPSIMNAIVKSKPKTKNKK